MTTMEITEQVPPPAVFTRLIETPPGMPWDQMRVAQLEASRAAPVAMSGLTLRVKRRGRWSHGVRGKFAALYVKTEDLGGGFTASVDIDGRQMRIDFRSKAQAEVEAKRVLVLLAAGGFAVLLSIAVAFAAGAAGSRAKDKLDVLERLTTRQLRQAQTASALKGQNAALNRISDRGEPLAVVLSDLAVASKSRLSATPLEGFHWRHDALGVEVRGEASPFPAGEARRLTKPLRPGVWLWAKERGAAPAPRPSRGAP